LRKSPKLIAWLVEIEKMDLNARDSSNWTPLYCYLDDESLFPTKYADPEAIQSFVDKWDADISAKNTDGVSCFIRYLRLKLVDLKGVKHWVEDKKADVRDVTRSGQTVLYYAVRWGKLDVIKWLVEEKGVDPHAHNLDGKTAADVCSNNETITWLNSIERWWW
jgi:ankyrin repeat protein